MIELEKTYLLKNLPEGIENSEFKEIIDIYLPQNSEHPKIRIRKNGDKFEITKKEPINNDASEQKEETIHLTKEEFDAFSNLNGKNIRKFRYYLTYNDLIAEIDVFKDNLKGLILVDFEFLDSERKNNFKIPNFCLADVSNEIFIAGGMICGKNYSDIEDNLNKFGYKKLFF